MSPEEPTRRLDALYDIHGNPSALEAVIEDALAARVRATDYPLAEEFVRQNVLEPPSESDMLELFRHSEVGGSG